MGREALRISLFYSVPLLLKARFLKGMLQLFLPGLRFVELSVLF